MGSPLAYPCPFYVTTRNGGSGLARRGAVLILMFVVNGWCREYLPRAAVSGGLGSTGEDAAAQDNG